MARLLIVGGGHGFWDETMVGSQGET
jgi:hypothetical protein